jgi:hypothetical protein
LVYKIKAFKIAKRLKISVMKKLVIIAGILFGFSQQNLVKAVDDVYDAPQPKQVRVKQTYTEPSKQVQPIEQTAPYYDEDNSNSRVQSNNVNRSNNYDDRDDRMYSDDYSGSSFGYSDRIRRFHNPSIQFSYGWNNWNNNFYDPWYNNSWNNWNNFSFSPSWSYGYSNFYNPFYTNTQILIIQPGFNSWYNNGFYNPYYSYYGNSYGFNNFGWNGFSPYCSNVIYNNGYTNYNNYYDANRKTVVSAPRTSGYSNSNQYRNNTSTYNNSGNSNSNSNNGNWNVNNNTPSNTPNKKWSNNNNNNPQPQNQGSWSNPYKSSTPTYNNNTPSNNSGWNNSNNSSSPAPSNGSGNGGVKIGTRPK